MSTPRTLALLVCLFMGCAGARPAAPAASPHADVFDEHITALMRRHGLRGAQVVVARGDARVVERAYGEARAGESMSTETRMRIASLSKPITAAAVHLLASDGELSLDDPILGHLSLETAPTDARWQQITVRHLLEHSAGFDRHESRDWMFESNFIVKATGQPGPPELTDVVRYVASQPLDFDPGARFAYSNFGYALLGQVIERVAGEPYEAVVRRLILEPSGAHRMELGRTLPADRPADEASYFADASEAELPSVFPGQGDVPSPDGGFYLRPMAAHGGWIANAADLARVLARLDARPEPADLLSAESLEAMLAPPRHATFEGRDEHYGHGFFVVPSERGRAWLHDGSKPGTTSFMMRTEDGTLMVALFNGRPTTGDVSRDVERTLRVAFAQIDPVDAAASQTQEAP